MLFMKSAAICKMKYIGQTCWLLHYKINNHKSDSLFNPSVTHNKSKIEWQHFNIHTFKDSRIQIQKIHKPYHRRLF